MKVLENLYEIFFHKFCAFIFVWIDYWYSISFLFTSSIFFLIILFIYWFEVFTESINSASDNTNSRSTSGFGSIATIFLIASLKSIMFLGLVIVSNAL